MPTDLVPQPHGGALRTPWAPGRSGNPTGVGGRPKGLMARVQRKCGRDGKKLVDLLYVLAVGTPEERREAFGEPVEVSAKDRRECIRELLDRGWGKSDAPRDENDVPLVADTPPQVVINLPRPQRELDHPAAVVVQDVLGPRRG